MKEFNLEVNLAQKQQSKWQVIVYGSEVIRTLKERCFYSGGGINAIVE